MAEENSYNTLYLHNVIIEFISFVVILIEDHGPRSLRNINNHLNFFSKDIYNFIEIFNGKDTEEKIGDMLCTTTPIFDVKERILYLSDNYRHFKQLIYKEFLTSKIIDLVLRGICFVKDICRNLNMNSIINIEEDNLKTMLKRSTYFSLNSDNVIVLHFHGLLGFNNHIYNGVVKYFQSYLQNINLLTYNEIKWHAKFVPSCSVLNCLVIFCVLHVSTIFKCEKDEVRLKKKFKRKNSGNKIINVEELKIKSSEAIPVGQIVSRALGPVLRNWTGEITQVTKSNGLIQCVVNFANSYGIFVIYFYKSALKYVCELEDLRDYLSIRDSVEFDAEFSEEEIQQGIFWQAIHVRVTKQALKKSKFEIDIDADMYMEKIKCNYNTFKVSSKTCKNCTANYCALESDIKNINKTVRGKESFSNSTNLNIKKATNLCCKQSKPLKNSYTLSQYHTLNGVVATNMLKSDDIILQSPTEELTTDKRIPKDYLNKKDVTIQDSKICNSNLQVQEQHISKVDLAVNKSIVSIASKEINHPKNFEVCDNKEEAIKDYDRKTLIPSSDKSFFQEVNGKNLHSKSDLISLEKNEDST
ncbi:hypothetical protein CEXT_118781 [Caerostris extrusa]|uniref:Uncharacterized protein n=1 Tax=Caerostris extrusa TaxID=172846 RepID=A0AAV4VT75_CAEEX|nr:hypothetical protein CEXT_118781 [Caerostris extrusa]